MDREGGPNDLSSSEEVPSVYSSGADEFSLELLLELLLELPFEPERDEFVVWIRIELRIESNE